MHAVNQHMELFCFNKTVFQFRGEKKFDCQMCKDKSSPAALKGNDCSALPLLTQGMENHL